MVEGKETKLVHINIDDKDYKVPSGMNLVDAAERVGVEIPHYCYHSKLSLAGNCRMCLVEMGTPMRDRATGEPILDEHGSPQIGWMPKPAIACASKATPGLHIKTQSPLAKSCQEGVMEFLLANHPLDCPICDQAGECRLQTFATDYGRGFSRYIEPKNVKPKRTRLGPRVTLDDERCILCSRCVRFCEEIDKKPVLGFIDRGSHSTLACYPDRELDSNYSLNTVDICPVGALTSTDFRFKMRVWFLKRTKSICTESSVGVNTEVWSREGKIYRITPRQNDGVNDTWMSDSGRELHKAVEAENRLQAFQVNRGPVSLGEAICHAQELISGGTVAYVASGHMTLEEQWMLRSLTEAAPGKVHFVSHCAEGDGKLISTDRTPNLRGALVTGLIHDLPNARLDALAKEIISGEVTTVVTFGEHLMEAGISQKLLKKVKLVYLGTHHNECSILAQVTLPTLMVFEKSGSFVNQQFRLQRFHQCIPGPAGLLPDTVLLARLTSKIRGGNTPDRSLASIWKGLAETLPIFNDLSFATISDLGTQLNDSAFARLPFCEKKGLHYQPQTTAHSGQQDLIQCDSQDEKGK